MYQVIVQTWVNGVRENDMVLTKTYSKKGFADRKAKEFQTGIIRGFNDTYIKRKVYVRKMLKQVSEEEAKAMYCRCEPVWGESKHGYFKLTPSWDYGSHAPIETLFYRSAGDYYNGNFYVEID